MLYSCHLNIIYNKLCVQIPKFIIHAFRLSLFFFREIFEVEYRVTHPVNVSLKGQTDH